MISRFIFCVKLGALTDVAAKEASLRVFSGQQSRVSVLFVSKIGKL
jgi:hypothetical protein